ncbi:hypothetical protein VJ923_11970 [Adlercreutzia sp. R25]|uniref:hypothetical protein n=1 Tax=Adlercreutzia shanghongiae TaxID=3111773 RepID=UPI002DBB2BB3|nr:hypothetical protein [Adlercreutzia sp. R25]MEC4273875.1 hypothetical protein [Adlercreutzia sp. R25]
MRFVLYGRSAIPVWLTAYHKPALANLSNNGLLPKSIREDVALSFLKEKLPQVPPPYQLSAAEWRGGPKLGIEVRTTQRALPEHSFHCLDHGLFIPSPELCLLEVARTASMPELIMLGSALCGAFVIDPSRKSGLGQRKPLATKESIGAFVEACAGHRGVENLRRATAFLKEGAASPPEVFLNMALTLPGRLGGFGLTRCVANKAIKLSKRAASIAERSTVVPDLLWDEARVAVEYDSNSEHLSPAQVTRDAKKRMALEADGYTVITVTTSQLAQIKPMEDVASEIARRAGTRRRTRSVNYRNRQAELFSTSRTLSDWINLDWAREKREGRG